MSRSNRLGHVPVSNRKMARIRNQRNHQFDHDKPQATRGQQENFCSYWNTLPQIAKREDEERSATAPKLDVTVEKTSVLHLLEISWLTWSLMLKTFDL